MADRTVNATPFGEPLPRSFFARAPEVVARALLGTVVVTGAGADLVAVRLTETEAYHGATDPASHAYRGRTARNAVMFGPAGHLYLYFVYGMHWCANVVTGAPGVASAVLLRAGEVVAGESVARSRRPAGRNSRELASGPARLATVLGWGERAAAEEANGADLCGPPGPPAAAPVRIFAAGTASTGESTGESTPVEVAAGPRVGVAAAVDEPLRFWLVGDPTVSLYRPRMARRRSRGG